MGIDIVYIALGFALGGVLKGATGAGAPIVAIPVIALYFDVSLAVAVFIVPNLVSNTYQLLKYRKHLLPRDFVTRFAGAGVIGVAIGTSFLVTLSADALKVGVAIVVQCFAAFRLIHPLWRLQFATARQIALPVGFFAGALQGASGISAPVSITFLNALQLERKQFIASISVFFLSMLLVQIPMLAGFGQLTPDRLLMGVGATVILLSFMPVGAYLARHISKETFDHAILVLLMLLSLKLLFDVFWVDI